MWVLKIRNSIIRKIIAPFIIRGYRDTQEEESVQALKKIYDLPIIYNRHYIYHRYHPDFE